MDGENLKLTVLIN